MTYYNPRELHQTGALPQGGLLSGRPQSSYGTGSTPSLTCVP